MAKSTKKYTTDTSYKVDFEDDYEDFGYEIANAKRYTSRNKSQRKFKDTDYYDDWPTMCATNWSVTLIIQGFRCCDSVYIRCIFSCSILNPTFPLMLSIQMDFSSGQQLYVQLSEAFQQYLAEEIATQMVEYSVDMDDINCEMELDYTTQEWVTIKN